MPNTPEVDSAIKTIQKEVTEQIGEEAKAILDKVDAKLGQKMDPATRSEIEEMLSSEIAMCMRGVLKRLADMPT